MTRLIRDRLKTTLRSEHKGVVAIEATILMPLMFLTMLALLYLLFMVLSYITYGNIASSVAHQMNMRQSGYAEAYNRYGTHGMPTVYTHAVSSHDQGRYATNDKSYTLSVSDVTFSQNETPLLRAGLWFALDVSGRASAGNNTMNGTADQFIIPFVNVSKIDCAASKPLTYNAGTDRGNNKFANTVVRVTIRCDCVNPFGVFNWFDNDLYGAVGQYSSLIHFDAIGYDVIA